MIFALLIVVPMLCVLEGLHYFCANCFNGYCDGFKRLKGLLLLPPLLVSPACFKIKAMKKKFKI
jgi:hypothetical protein